MSRLTFDSVAAIFAENKINLIKIGNTYQWRKPNEALLITYTSLKSCIEWLEKYKSEQVKEQPTEQLAPQVYTFEFSEFNLELWESEQSGIYLVGKAGEENPIGKCQPTDTTPEGLENEAERLYHKLTGQTIEPAFYDSNDRPVYLLSYAIVLLHRGETIYSSAHSDSRLIQDLRIGFDGLLEVEQIGDQCFICRLNELALFRSSLDLAADSPEDLRPGDVDRIMDDANDRGYLQGFKEWLFSQELEKRTRQVIETWEPEDVDSSTDSDGNEPTPIQPDSDPDGGEAEPAQEGDSVQIDGKEYRISRIMPDAIQLEPTDRSPLGKRLKHAEFTQKTGLSIAPVTREDYQKRVDEEKLQYLKPSLLLAADSPEDLRPGDVDRVMSDACDRGYLDPFKSWMLSQKLQPKTRQLIKEWRPDDDLPVINKIEPGNGPGNGPANEPTQNLKLRNAQPFSDFSHLQPGVGAKTKLTYNKAALKLLQQLKAEDRSPSPQERATLARYVGNGTIAGAIDGEYLALTDKQASLETDNAFQTDPAVIEATWKVLSNLGFTHGRILDPSCSIGNFAGLQPAEHRSRSEWVMVEINPDAAAIARLLHEDAIAVYNKPFESCPLPQNSFDLVISNFPFSQVKPFDPNYADLNLNLHNYFFIKSLDLIRVGGVIAAITSTSTLDNPEFCRLMAERGAYLVGAVRLPSNAFKSMNTQVTTDLIIFKKLPYPEIRQIFVSGNRETDVQNREGKFLELNEYFWKNPQQVLGTLTPSTLYGGQTSLAVTADDRNLSEAIVVAFPPLALYKPDTHPKSLKSALLPEALIGLNPYSFIEQDRKIYQYRPEQGLTLVTEHVERIRAGLALKRDLDQLINLEVNDSDEAAIENQRDRLNRTYGDFIRQYGNLLDPWKRNKRIFEDDSELYSMLFSLEEETEVEIESGVSGKTIAELELLDLEDLQRLAEECSFSPNDRSGKPHGKRKLINLIGPKTRIEYRKTDIFSQRISGKLRKDGNRIETVQDALHYSLNNTGEINLSLIASLTGKTTDEAVLELNSVETPQVFYCPQAKCWQLYSEYISGDTRSKLALIKAIESADPELYQAQFLHYNKQELSKQDNEGRYTNINPYLLPPCDADTRAAIAGRLKREQDIDSELSSKLFIVAGLGTPWIEPGHIAEFTAYLVGCESEDIRVDYAPGLALWGLQAKYSYVKERASKSEYSTPDRNAIDLILLSLNQQKVQVDIFVKVDGNSVKDKEASEKATNAAIAQQERIKTAFVKWLWDDSDRVWHYTQKYNRLFPRPRKRDYSAPWLTLPGSNAAITLRPHQLAAVNRILQNPATLLLHEVGTGKTFSMIAASYEAKRLNKANKPMLAVLKSTVSQIVGAYKTLYPHAKLLIADADDKNKTFVKIQTGNYDCIILTHDQFYALPVETKTKLAYIQEQLDLIAEYKNDAHSDDRLLKRELENYELSLEAEVERITTLDMLEDMADDPDKLKAYLADLLAKDTIAIDDKGKVKYLGARKPKTQKEQKLEDKRRDRLTSSLERAMHHYTQHTVKAVKWEKLGIDFACFDECFPYETPIITNQGILPIGRIVEERLKVMVLSCDLSDNKLQWKPVTAWMPKPLNKQMVKVTHEHGEFFCTEDHKIWTIEKGYVKAGELNADLHLSLLSDRVQALEARESRVKVLRPELCSEVCSSEADHRDKELSNLRQSILTERHEGSRITSLLQLGVYESGASKNHNQKLRTVQRGILVPLVRRGEQQQKTVLRMFVRCKMADDATRAIGYFQTGCYSSKQTQKRNQKPASFRANEAEQSRISSRGQGENSPDPNTERKLESHRSRRKRATNARATAQASRSLELYGYGRICRENSDSKTSICGEVAQQLQNRHCNPASDDSDRDRRNISQFAEEARAGQAQGCCTESSRVVSVEIQKSGSAGEFRGSVRPHTVYDITVADNHNYFASGVLVSNCHALKNLKTPSKLYGISGVQMPDTQRTLNCLLKFRYTADRNGKIIGATGTMPTNTVAELYVMQRFFMPEELDRVGLKHFDSWIGQFAEARTSLEFTSTGGIKTKTRINRFKNLLQLMDLQRSFTDFVTADQINIQRPDAHHIAITAQPNADQLSVIERIAIYMKMWQSGRDKGAKYFSASQGKVVEHNPLTLTNMGSQNAIDPRLVEPTAQNYADSKINRVVHNAYWLWQASEPISGVQLIFCDTGTPNGQHGLFNVYVYVRDALIALGVPAEQIAFIHDFEGKKRQQLFDAINSGKVRFLLGSTEKAGTGVNVQRLCIALHHIDMSWTPAKQEQRNGRGHRQGNLNPDVFIFYYGTAGKGNAPGFDAYKSKLVSDKAAFIYQILSDNVIDCVAEDIGDDAAMYLMAAAILSGNGQALEHAKLTDKIRRIEADLETQYNQLTRNSYRLNNVDDWIEKEQEKLDLAIADQNSAKALGDLTGKGFRITLGKQTFTKFSEAEEELTNIRLRTTEAPGTYTIGKIGKFDIILQVTSRYVEISLMGELSKIKWYSCETATLHGIRRKINEIADGFFANQHQRVLEEYRHEKTVLPRQIDNLKAQVSELSAQLTPLKAEECKLREALQAEIKDEPTHTQRMPSDKELVDAPTPALYHGVEPDVIEAIRSLPEPTSQDADGNLIEWLPQIRSQCALLAQKLAAPPEIEQKREELERVFNQAAATEPEPAQPAPEPEPTPTTTVEPAPATPARRTAKRRPATVPAISQVKKTKVVNLADRRNRKQPAAPEPAPMAIVPDVPATVQPLTRERINKVLKAIARTTHKQFAVLGIGADATERVVEATVDAAKREMGLVFEVDGYRFEDLTLKQNKRTGKVAGVAQGCLF